MARGDRKGRTIGDSGSDLLALGIAVASVILFAATAGSLLPQALEFLQRGWDKSDLLLVNAVLLNVALLLFGWRRYVDLRREVAERRKAEERARLLAERDPLVHCLNRRSGIPALEAAVAKSVTARRDLAVFMFDVDNFKKINDVNGHSAGDAVLVQTVARLEAILPTGSLMIRVGGDEFACCVPLHADDREWTENLALQLLQTVRQPVEGFALQSELTVSLGLTVHRHGEGVLDAAGCERLIHRADLAMYHAKKAGRNRHVWFEPSMEDQLRRRGQLGAAIRAGIAAGEFVPFYEQQVDINTGQLVGFEMLARWNSPAYGLVAPDVFIPIAEEIDQIAALSESLMRRAMLDAKDWDPRLTLSVNISPIQLRDPWFAQKVVRLLTDTGFPAGRLELEITESCLHLDIAAVQTVVSSLKNQGIRISLDDFGTGYSSLAQLRVLPFDRIKIDRSFVAELSGPEGAELVKAIVAIGRGLNLPVTAEGIETPQMVDVLRQLGELKGQGYLYGRPEDSAATRARLADLGLLSGQQDVAQVAAAPLMLRKAG